MRINANLNASAVDGSLPTKRPAPATPSAAEGVSFSAADALDASMKNAPDVRAGSVELAKRLINDPQYPSPGVLQGVANTLAKGILSSGE